MYLTKASVCSKDVTKFFFFFLDEALFSGVPIVTEKIGLLRQWPNSFEIVCLK